ncbi:hypothetical protein NE237_024886 [Protea cynaroides]|uniref:Uncharacterized protein n=1 Tax=Protea cynaroides TaxID=273540 RepID=A0A9Q0H463_9MAGN|nr:hypothetical protein NE237_024886 [Protea cynaroides]
MVSGVGIIPGLGSGFGVISTLAQGRVAIHLPKVAAVEMVIESVEFSVVEKKKKGRGRPRKDQQGVSDFVSHKDLFLDVRGISNPQSRSVVQLLVKEHSSDLLCFLELKVAPDKFLKALFHSLGYNTNFFHNARQSAIPNLWLVLEGRVTNPTLVSSSAQ